MPTTPIHLAYHATQARNEDLARAAQSSRRRSAFESPRRHSRQGLRGRTRLRPLARLLWPA